MGLFESLDFSSNELTDTIPWQLTSLTFLETLNLSVNNFSGAIPQERKFNTFSNDSFLGNLALCGFPMTKKCRNDEKKTREVDDVDNEDWFKWKIIVMGYGAGLVCGLSRGYIVFTTRKPWRCVKFLEGAQQKLIK
ncbi:receptor like protein 30-like [Heracleum sosnowskyi]|uniref:Receptor like protein 30-like n=1 Tax=Heracleum sosnowskyi TaxID=360622 RepID=A0AAD8IMX5_9APIA|nr:receptor like protein 30-like [Heracleum sosnowskyi]